MLWRKRVLGELPWRRLARAIRGSGTYHLFDGQSLPGSRVQLASIARAQTPAARVQRQHLSARTRGPAQWKAVSTAAEARAGRGRQGLYGVDGLVEPEDFPQLAAAAATEVQELMAFAVGGESSGTVRGQAFVAVLDQISDTVCLVMDAAELCRSTHPQQEWKRAAMQAYDVLAHLVATLNMNTPLYQALERCVSRATSKGDVHVNDQLDDEGLRVAQLLLTDFQRGGVHLDDGGRKRVLDLQDEIGQLCFQFVDGGAAEVPPRIQVPTAVARLLPQEILRFVSWRAGEEGGEAELTVTREAYHLVLQQVPQGSLRKAVFLAAHGYTSKVATLERMLLLRHALAHEMGYPSYADMSMVGKMASSPDAARALLLRLAKGLAAKAREEARILLRLKAEIEGRQQGEGAEHERLESWDRQLLSAQARRNSLGAQGMVDIREYLPLSTVIAGIGRLLERTFAVTLEPVAVAPGEGWAPTVHKVRISMPGSDGVPVHLGTLFLDLWARPGKLAGAAHFTVQCGRQLASGEYRSPVVALSCCFSPDARAGQPLLTHHDLETLLHEFGHVLHSVLGRTRFQHLSGTRSVVDVVEVPSTLMENFAHDPGVLTAMTGHYVTNEPVPAAALEALAQQRKLFSALDTLHQVVYGLVDLSLHAHTPKAQEEPGWSYAVAMRAAEAAGSPVVPAEGCYWYADLSHLASYGANYYSYMWSRAVSALVWRAHFARAPLAPNAGLPFVRGFLSRGGSREGHDMVADVLAEGSTGSEGRSLDEDMREASEALLQELTL